MGCDDPYRALSATVLDRALTPPDWATRDTNMDWGVRIDQIIAWVDQIEDKQTRGLAAYRLLKLFEANALREEEARRFGQALWRFKDEDGLPANANLLPHVFIEAPGADSKVVQEALEKAVILPLANGKIEVDAVQSLASMSYTLTAQYRPRLIEPEVARQIYDHLMNWPNSAEALNPSNAEKAHRIANAIPRALVATVI